MKIKDLIESYKKLGLDEMADVNCIGKELTDQNSSLSSNASLSDKIRYLVKEYYGDHWKRSRQALYELSNAIIYGEIQPEPNNPFEKSTINLY